MMELTMMELFSLWIICSAITCVVGVVATKDPNERKIWVIAGLLLGILGIPVALLLTAMDVDGNRKREEESKRRRALDHTQDRWIEKEYPETNNE